MWSSKRTSTAAALLLALVAPLALASCSGFTPVYGEHGVADQEVQLAYAAPTNRLEQVIYQQLALRLGKANGPGAPVLSVVATEESRDLTSNDLVVPGVPRQATVTAVVTLTGADGKVRFTGTRNASADYTGNAQGLASAAARTEAAERAAKALADTIRLTLIAALAHPAP